METQKFEIVTKQSHIDWIGRKVTGAHNGTIAIKEGTLDFTNDQLVGGKFIIDVTSIKILDLTDAASNAQFAGHLASDDFFSSSRYPNAIFEITATEKKSDTIYSVSGNLTIKDITHPANFEAEVILHGQNMSASGKIVIDRTLYNIKFRSGNFFQNLGDTLIYNDFESTVSLTAQGVPSPIKTNKYDSHAIH
jgi:polyisoprenoid-binding protein YceI